MKVIRSGKLAGTRFYVKPTFVVVLTVKPLCGKALRKNATPRQLGPIPLGRFVWR